MALFSAGQTLTAAEMNAINGFVQKTSDQSISSSTVLTNDSQLLYTIPAAGTYAFECNLVTTAAANAAGHLKIAFTFPTGTMTVSATGPDTSIASAGAVIGSWYGGAMTSGVTTLSYGCTTSGLSVFVKGILIATASGTLRLQWAQNASNANATTVKSGSHMLVRQVA